VRNNFIVIGGNTLQAILGSVEMVAEGEGSFTGQHP